MVMSTPIDRRALLGSAGLLAGATLVAARASAAQQNPERMRALVLAQSYPGEPRRGLANTVRDAALIAASCRRLGFAAVDMIGDGSADTTVTRIGAFLATVERGDVVLVYLVGHGVQILDENLLMLNGSTRFVSLQAFTRTLQERSDTVLVFLDACRNNPLDAPLPASAAVSRSIAGRGGPELIAMETVEIGALTPADGTPARITPFTLTGSGIKIVFSTDPYNVALDGVDPDSPNSPFATALAARLLERRSLDDVISLTTGDVLAATRQTQSPWAQGSIDRPLFLAGPPVQRNPARPRFQVPG